MKIHQNEDWLYEKYWEEMYTVEEMAEEAEVTFPTILHWMDKFDIDRRGRHWKTSKRPVNLELDERGAEVFRSRYKGNVDKIYHHQLLAIAYDKAEPSDLFVDNLVIHHKNEIPWDNREENLEVLTYREHMVTHWRPYWEREEVPESEA